MKIFLVLETCIKKKYRMEKKEKKNKPFIKNIFVKREKVKIYNWGEGEPPSPQKNIKYVLINNPDIINKNT